MENITMSQAMTVIGKACEKSDDIKTKMCVAVVDTGGNLVGFMKQDNAWRGSIDIAIKKAKTAGAFNMPTGTIGQLSQPGQSLYGIEHSNDGLITFPGGLTIINKTGDIIGAIGVSGDSVYNDELCATAGANSIG